jgi:putative mRNA 3-end processing factor
MAEALLELTPAGLYCSRGDFYIDPWRPVGRAVITHAHSDHARSGSARYLCAADGSHVLRLRLGAGAVVDGVAYGEQTTLNGVHVSLHPAGHILGSAQVRIEYQGQVCVASGDYKLHADPTCRPFEPLRCHTFISESTFGLPVFRWPQPARVVVEMHRWWRANKEAGKASVLYVYSLGKAQRVLAALDPSVGPLYTHGAVERFCLAYCAAGVPLPPTRPVAAMEKGTRWGGAMILAPPSAHGTPWLRRFGDFSTAVASGWMRVRGIRRRRAIDRGFVFSDHADWDGLLETIRATGAEAIWVSHGYTASLVRYLREQGYDAQRLETEFRGESLDEEAPGEENEP